MSQVIPRLEPEQPMRRNYLRVTVDRRIAAIVHADVAGYTRHVANGEGQALAKLEQRRAIIRMQADAHNGRIIDMAGDSVLTRFASGAEAVGFAVAVQDEIARLNAEVGSSGAMTFRIGIASGDVIEQDGVVVGECINIAARLQTLAEPGGFCVSRQIYEQVSGKSALNFRSLGEQRLKNVDVPIQAFAMTGAGGVSLIGTGKTGSLWNTKVLAAVLVAAVGIAGLAMWQRFGSASLQRIVQSSTQPNALRPPVLRLQQRDGPFDPARLPFLMGGTPRETVARYQEAAAPKAIMIGAKGGIFIADSASSAQAAADAVNLQCQAANEVNCLLLAVDNEFVVMVPGRYRITGLWNHLADPQLPESMRNQITIAFDAGVAGIAVAKGAGGAIGLVSGGASEADIINRAIESCARHGPGCKPFAYGPFLLGAE